MVGAFVVPTAVPWTSPHQVSSRRRDAVTTTTTLHVASLDMHSDKDKDNNEMVTQLPWLAMQFVAVLGIKAVKDLLYYPPQWVSTMATNSHDNANDSLSQQQRQEQSHRGDNNKNNNPNDNDDLDILNPPVLLMKFCLVLVFKTIHDAVYFPAVWAQRWYTCQSLDECPVSAE